MFIGRQSKTRATGTPIIIESINVNKYFEPLEKLMTVKPHTLLTPTIYKWIWRLNGACVKMRHTADYCTDPLAAGWVSSRKNILRWNAYELIDVALHIIIKNLWITAISKQLKSIIFAHMRLKTSSQYIKNITFCD